MKRFWWMLILGVAIIVTSLIYVMIPNNIVVGRITYIPLRSTISTKYLHDLSKWQQWFPSTSPKKFIYNNIEFNTGEMTYSNANILIVKNNDSFHSTITVFPYSYNSSLIRWSYSFQTSKNPFRRISEYMEAKNIWISMDALLENFKKSVQNTKNIYGFDINYTTLTDTALVSTITITKQYPDTRTIYKIIDKLKSYIISQHASVHNYPMLNITTLEDSTYKLMVGLPTNIPLKGNNEILPKRMVMIKNKTLVTEVKGDANEVQKGFAAIKYFMQDNHYQSPVIPFQQLITNRMEQPDSTKWITKIFAPYN